MMPCHLIFKQLMNDYEATTLLLIAVMEVPREEVSSWCHRSQGEGVNGLIVLAALLKNQSPSSPSNLAIIGRICFTPETESWKIKLLVEMKSNFDDY